MVTDPNAHARVPEGDLDNQVACRTAGGKDWYRWGVDLILPAQKEDGGWFTGTRLGSPVIDTCFALLFLKKSDLLPDLRETLQKRLKIVDPGASSSEKSDHPPKSPGEKKTEPKAESATPRVLRRTEFIPFWRTE